MVGTGWKEKIKVKEDLEWALACAGQKSHRRTLYLSAHNWQSLEIFEQRILGNVRIARVLLQLLLSN